MRRNGPTVITREMKQRQELTALATIMPDEMKPIIAKYFADTLKNDLGEDLSRNIIANLPPGVNFIDDNMDPAAVHQLNQMQATMEDTMTELEMKQKEVEDLRQQVMQLQLSMLDNRESRTQDWNKFVVSEQDKMALETMKLGVQSEKNEDETILKQQEINIKAAEADMNRQEKETDIAVNSYADGVNDAAKAILGGNK